MNARTEPESLGRAYLLLVAVVTFWGVNWPIMKIGLDYLSPLWFAAMRMGLGALCLIAFMVWQRQLLNPGRRELPMVIAVGVFQIGLPTALIHSGLLFMEAGRSAILVFTIPLWVAPLAAVFLKERLSAAKAAGLAAGMGGIAVLFNPATFDFGDGRALLGNAMMLLASMSFAVAIIIVRRYRWPVPVIRLMPWQMLFGTGILIAAAALIEGTPQVRWSGALAAIMAYNGPVASAFCFWAYVTVSRDLPAMSTALGSLGVPAVGILASALLLGEALTLTRILGLVLIALGVLAVSVDLNRTKSSK